MVEQSLLVFRQENFLVFIREVTFISLLSLGSNCSIAFHQRNALLLSERKAASIILLYHLHSVELLRRCCSAVFLVLLSFSNCQVRDACVLHVLYVAAAYSKKSFFFLRVKDVYEKLLITPLCITQMISSKYIISVEIMFCSMKCLKRVV